MYVGSAWAVLCTNAQSQVSMEEGKIKNQAGFSVLKMFFWIVFIAAAFKAGYELIPVHYTAWKVDDAFQTISRTMSSSDEALIRARLPDILKAKYIAYHDLPQEFYDYLIIEADGGSVKISSEYHVTVWLLGQPAEAAQTNDSMQAGWERLQTKGRFDFDFFPHAETP